MPSVINFCVSSTLNLVFVMPIRICNVAPESISYCGCNVQMFNENFWSWSVDCGTVF
jgi:hypothetical protein